MATSTSPIQDSLKVRFPAVEFLVVFVPVALAILVGGYFFTSTNLELRFEEMLGRDREQLFLLRGFVVADVKSSAYHLQALSQQSEQMDALDRDTPANLARLRAEFLQFAERNPQYQQVRWIDQHGVERVRVNRIGGALLATPDSELQDKSDRYYVEQTSALLAGEIYVSPVDLNVEHGQVEMPPRPVLRVAMPLFDSAGNRRGSLVLNLSLKELFNVAQNEYLRQGQKEIFLLNEQGVQLNASTPQGEKQSLDFTASHPSAWSGIGSSDRGYREAMDGFWIWDKVASLGAFTPGFAHVPGAANSRPQVFRDNFSLTFVSRRPKHVLMNMRRDSRVMGSLSAILAVTVFGFALYLYLGGHVRAQQARLAAADAKVRASRAEKEKELEKRFHTLVEASSIGQLVVDQEGTIQLANPAIEALLGYSPRELLGQPIEKLVSADFRGRHAALRNDYLQSPGPRKMGAGRIFDARHKDGSSVPVEVGLNPYLENGLQRVLVNVVGRLPPAE